jgi:hypothetical protein
MDICIIYGYMIGWDPGEAMAFRQQGVRYHVRCQLQILLGHELVCYAIFKLTPILYLSILQRNAVLIGF